MRCTNCGVELPSDGKFCANCGTKIELPTEPDVAPEEIPTTITNPEESSVSNIAPEEKSVAKKKLSRPLIIAISAAATVLLAIIIVLSVLFASSRAISDEKAEDIFDDVIAQLEDFEYEEAEAILNKIKLKEDSKYTDKLNELKEIVKVKPEFVSADVSDYPNITVEIETDHRKTEYKKDDFEILCENSDIVPISALTKDGNVYKITYTTPEDEGGKRIEDKLVFAKYQNVDFFIPFKYDSEYVTDANISFVTSNVDNYPEISLYFKVTDEYGNPIENLTKKSFSIKEYIDINDYLERDVIYAAKVNENDALNVSLAIDRSASIYDSDMVKIKNATNNFLSKLQFSSGDKAEIVAFESTVMQMCLFTNNKTNLMNGVNSMYPYGLTACYDAIVTSIHNASAQSGARCVIVFTDGYDNESVNTVDSVINLANAKSVPIYTIGVGSSLAEDDLRRIANSTGGTYHHIDDISAMSQIYEEIYREQKNLYHVKYVSDSSIEPNAERRIIAQVKGSGYRGECERVYTPIIPVKPGSHSSRYEVIKADITWEEANRACIEKGGHLATITSRDEEEKIIAAAEKANIGRLWIGGYTTNNQYGEAVGHWVMGEPFVYQNWFSEDEPSRFDSDNAAEFYLMLWKIDGRWSWNDQRNDLINSPFASTYKGKMGYVIEYEN